LRVRLYQLLDSPHICTGERCTGARKPCLAAPCWQRGTACRGPSPVHEQLNKRAAAEAPSQPRNQARWHCWRMKWSMIISSPHARSTGQKACLVTPQCASSTEAWRDPDRCKRHEDRDARHASAASSSLALVVGDNRWIAAARHTGTHLASAWPPTCHPSPRPCIIMELQGSHIMPFLT
jgi:hypothetical protein